MEHLVHVHIHLQDTDVGSWRTAALCDLSELQVTHDFCC